MAAWRIGAALEGTNGQMEHAAEIAMEHKLGMTCDPTGGLIASAATVAREFFRMFRTHDASAWEPSGGNRLSTVRSRRSPNISVAMKLQSELPSSIVGATGRLREMSTASS